MNLLEELAAERASRGPDCGVGKVMGTMAPSDQADLEASLASIYPSTLISRVLANHGIELKPDALQRHRRGECKCQSKKS